MLGDADKVQHKMIIFPLKETLTFHLNQIKLYSKSALPKKLNQFEFAQGV